MLFLSSDLFSSTVIAGIPNRGKSIMQDRQTDISNSDISNAAEVRKTWQKFNLTPLFPSLLDVIFY